MAEVSDRENGEGMRGKWFSEGVGSGRWYRMARCEMQRGGHMVMGPRGEYRLFGLLPLAVKLGWRGGFENI